MTSLLSRKRKSPEPDRDGSHEDQITTPTGSPARKKLKISQSQKQALIDNLQLEITERARKLRAQYALQAQDLRARIERRVNRIPVALRRTTMGQLLEKYTAATQTTQTSKKPTASARAAKNAAGPTISRDLDGPSTSTTVKASSRRVKQTSDDFTYSDKENAPVPMDAHMPLDNPKKRGNQNGAGQSRAVSQVMRGAEAKILSPKSSNSRTYHQSPLPASSTKPSYLSRPASPIKPSSPLKAMIENARARTGARDMPTENRVASPTATTRKAKTTSQTTRKATTKTAKPTTTKSPARSATRQQDRNPSTSTTSSNLSTGTTIVKAARGAAAKRTAMATTSSAAAKRNAVRSQGPTAAATAKRTAATTKRAAAEAPPSTGRVLRKRA